MEKYPEKESSNLIETPDIDHQYLHKMVEQLRPALELFYLLRLYRAIGSIKLILFLP